MCSTKDLDRRIILAEAAFGRLWSLWLRPQRVSLKRRLRLYEALVISVLMYNASCWAVPATQLKRVDTMQRRHLRRILRIRWPHRISNEALYARCECRPPVGKST